MIIKAVKLYNYRNYHSESVAFSSGVNIIYGDNAQGKTNLLEAAAYFSVLKPFRSSAEKEAIGSFGDSFAVDCSLVSHGRDFELSVRCGESVKKTLSVNGIKKPRQQDALGILKGVIFCPDHLEMIKLSGGAKRRYMDMSIIGLSPKYYGALSSYNRTLAQKSGFLKREDAGLHKDLLDTYNIKLSEHAGIIINMRARFVKEIGLRAANVVSDMTSGDEELSVDYVTDRYVEHPTGAPKEIAKQIYSHLCLRTDAEMASQSCLVGPHKDDLIFYINGMDAKSYGSQGQQRTLTAALKLSECELVYEDCGEQPVLFLDDIMSELDVFRQDYILNKITDRQVIMTCCEKEKFEALKGGRLIKIKGGKVAALSDS